MRTALIFLFCLLASAILPGCGGGSSSSSSSTATSSTSTVRIMNLTSELTSIDLMSGSSVVTSTGGFGSSSSFVSVSSGTTTFSINPSGTGVPVTSSTITLTSGVAHSLYLYKIGQTYQMSYFIENETAPSTGYGKIRVYNLANLDGGAMDIYFVTHGGAIDAAAALAGSLSGLNSFAQIAAGTYDIWATAAGNKSDVRFFAPSISIADQQISTLFLTSAPGGLLANGVFWIQGGSVTGIQNSSSLVRLATNLTSTSSLVTVTINGTSLGSASVSPSINSYTNITSGALSVTVQIDGKSVSAQNLSASPGSSMTLLIYGDPSSPQFSLMNDDVKSVMSGTARIRLYNGMNGTNDSLSLTADYSLIASNTPPGAESGSATLPSGTIGRLEVNEAQGNASIYVATNVVLQSGGAYSLFILGSKANPIVILRRDR